MIYGQFKVLESGFFNRISLDARTQFIEELLLTNLSGEPKKQQLVLASNGFVGLPPVNQSKLLYYLGMDNILDSKEAEIGRSRLLESLDIYPGNIKARFALFLLIFGNRPLRIARALARIVRKGISKPSNYPHSLPVGVP